MRVQPVANTYPQLLTRSNSMLSSGITHILCAASYDAFPQAYHPGELALAQPVYCGQGKAAGSRRHVLFAAARNALA